MKKDIDEKLVEFSKELHKEIQKKREAKIIKFLTSFGFSKNQILAYIPVLSEESFQFAEGVDLELDKLTIGTMMSMISFCGTNDKTIKILMEKGVAFDAIYAFTGINEEMIKKHYSESVEG